MDEFGLVQKLAVSQETADRYEAYQEKLLANHALSEKIRDMIDQLHQRDTEELFG